MAKTAQTAASNWSGSSSRAATAYNEGVQSTTKDWASLATQAVPRMVQGFNEAANSGRISQGINAIGTGGWKAATQAKSNNYSAAAAKFMPAIASGVASLPARGDINQNLQRANALALYLHGLKGTLGAR